MHLNNCKLNLKYLKMEWIQFDKWMDEQFKELEKSMYELKLIELEDEIN